MVDHIKALMKEYHQALLAADRAAEIKKQLIPLLRDPQWADRPFKFSDRTIKYQCEERASSLSQKLIKPVLQREYPELASDIMKKILQARTYKPYESLVSIKNKTGGRGRNESLSDDEN